ncbi:Protein CBG06467 [Caenorhabditis briggsae]|uniref:Protein CBG06467 n=1 Tax=Caenorhabditis briggsae TaxID=6238 RepID=A8X2A4_CAEBR|nr:Protein CBG06467 [Caenorhabditis briggsae]CAP26764.2 Protein CBG06467 [Caenorhabditis briggsae]
MWSAIWSIHPGIAKCITSSTIIICILQFFGFAINLVHLSILSRPQMRSNLVYRLMIGICICDLLTQVNTFVLFTPFWIRDSSKQEETCTRRYVYFEAFLYLHGISLLDITQRGASWMALFMALNRMLSVKFPMSVRIQKLTKPVAAFRTILGVLIFTSFTTWMVQSRRIIAEYDWDFDCNNNVILLNDTNEVRYAHYIPDEDAEIQVKLVAVYGFIKLLPSLIDPILTIFLILELKKASKRRKDSGIRENDKTENTTKLNNYGTCSGFRRMPSYHKLLDSSFHMSFDVFSVPDDR